MKLTKEEKLRIKQWEEFNHIVTTPKIVSLTSVMIIVVGLNTFNEVKVLKLRPPSWAKGWV